MLLVAGRVVRPHGIRGDLILEVRTDEPEERFVPGSVFITDPRDKGPLTLDTVRWYQGRLLATFEGVNDRDTAETLRSVLLCVDSDDIELPDDPDEFADHQLVGLEVIESDGTVVGRVSRIDHNAAHDTLVVDRAQRNPALIPFIHAMVPTIDIDNGRIVVDLPPGLLDL